MVQYFYIWSGALPVINGTLSNWKEWENVPIIYSNYGIVHCSIIDIIIIFSEILQIYVRFDHAVWILCVMFVHIIGITYVLFPVKVRLGSTLRVADEQTY